MSGHVKKKKFRKKEKKKQKHYEVKAKGLTQTGLFPTLLSPNCSALPHSQSNCDLLCFISQTVRRSGILTAVNLDLQIRSAPTAPHAGSFSQTQPKGQANSAGFGI